MVERAQPQLLLVSTAHRLTTELMLERRRVALAGLEDGDGDLLIEWSAPHDAELADVEAWRLASPHWTPKRERMIGKRLEAAKMGEVDVDAEEPDPEQSFRAQWLNQWPRRRTAPPGNTEDLLPLGLWAELEDQGLGFGPLIVALEDDYGRGAAVGACWRMDDGRIAVDGWTTDDWDSAILHVERLHVMRPVTELYVGASLLDRVPKDGQWAPRPVGMTEARAGLAVFRDLAASGMLAHDDTHRARPRSRADAGARIAVGPRGRARPGAPDQSRRLGRARRAQARAGSGDPLDGQPSSRLDWMSSVGLTDLFVRSIRPPDPERHHPEPERPGAEPARVRWPRPARQPRRPRRRRGPHRRHHSHLPAIMPSLWSGYPKLVAAAVEQPRPVADRHGLDVHRFERLAAVDDAAVSRQRGADVGRRLAHQPRAGHCTRAGRSSPSSCSGTTRLSAKRSCWRRRSIRRAGRRRSMSSRRGRSKSTWTDGLRRYRIGSTELVARTSSCTCATSRRRLTRTATAH